MEKQQRYPHFQIELWLRCNAASNNVQTTEFNNKIYFTSTLACKGEWGLRMKMVWFYF